MTSLEHLLFDKNDRIETMREALEKIAKLPYRPYASVAIDIACQTLRELGYPVPPQPNHEVPLSNRDV
jgi:hypothetical protein